MIRHKCPIDFENFLDHNVGRSMITDASVGCLIDENIQIPECTFAISKVHHGTVLELMARCAEPRTMSWRGGGDTDS